MRIIIARHGDPNYEIDSLTTTGWKEAELLSDRMVKYDNKYKIKDIYVSPLGRAKDTASKTLEKLNREAIECEWSREFAPRIHRPDTTQLKNAWDWLPGDWTKEADFYSVDTWTNPKAMSESDVPNEYKWVCDELDKLLEKHGYKRENNYYKVEKANEDTIVFFCHFGLECVLLSHLLHVSPMILWHGFCAPTSSVTLIYTEERRKGVASFRVNCFGDTSHLYVANQEPSFSARFCEMYANENERHD